MSFALRNRGEPVLHTDVNQYGTYLGGTREEAVTRVANSGVSYADTLRQTDTANGLIFRAGYGTSGAPTWMLDITKNNVVIRGGLLRSKGPYQYDVEAYANAADLNTDGSFKFDVDCTYAVNAAAAALRASSINGLSSGPFGGWYNARIVFNSRVYTASKTLNLTKLSGAIIESGAGKSVIYCGNSFTNSGPYDSGVAGSGTTITATNCPMMDLTGVNDCLIRGINLYAQQTLTGAVPVTKPGAGFLIASLEVRAGGVFNGTGGTFSSNNLVFERCSVLGYFGAAGFLINNSVIHNFTDCGGQIWTSNSAAHAFYVGRQTISPSSNTPVATGGVDSPFYPDPSVPADGDERMNRTETAAGAIVMTNCEWHDMAAIGDSPTIGHSNVLSTILLYKVFQFSYHGGPMSSSGRAGIEIQGFAKDISLYQVELYEDSSEAGAMPEYWIFNNQCNGANPVVNLSLRDCFVNTAPQTALIGGVDASYSGLILENNILAGTVIYSTLTGYTGAAATETLLGQCRMDCGGLPLNVGGSIGVSVELIQPGTVTVSGGGTAKHRAWTTTGRLNVQDGTTGSPAIGFVNDTNTGMRLYGADQVSLVAGGVDNLVVSNGVVYHPDGASASAPGMAFLGEGGLGVRRVSAGTGALCASTADILTWSSAGAKVSHLIGGGSAPSVGTLTGWGAGASVGAVSGTDTACFFTITAGVGPGASPTFVLTYATAFATSPIMIAVAVGGTGVSTSAPLRIQQSSSAPTFTYDITPVNGLTYLIQIVSIGK